MNKYKNKHFTIISRLLVNALLAMPTTNIDTFLGLNSSINSTYIVVLCGKAKLRLFADDKCCASLRLLLKKLDLIWAIMQLFIIRCIVLCLF